MNLDNSKLFESNILNSTTGNDTFFQFNTVGGLTIQEQRKQQSEAMFSDLHQMQRQKCETNFAKNQHIIRNFCDQENNFSKSNITGGPDLSFPLLSPNDLNLTYSPDEHDSTCGEIFVFSVKNIEKIAKFLNLDHVKLKNLFIKVINDEEVNEDFLSELNSKIMVDNNLTQYEQIDLPNSMIESGKNPIFNQSTQTNDEYVQVRPQEHFSRNENRFNMFIEQITYSSDHDYIQVRPPSSEQEKQSTLKNINPIFNSSERFNPTPSIRNLNVFDQMTQPNCEFIQKKAQIQENNSPMYSSQDGSHISSRLIIIADKLLHKNKVDNDVLSRNTNCRSPDLFSDSSSDDIIPPS